MIDTEEIRRRLRDYNLKAVAQKAGIHHNALYRFMSGQTDPRMSTVKKLSKYLEAEAKKHG